MTAEEYREKVNSCYCCDCWDEDAEGCTMSPIDRNYACPISEKQESVKKVQEIVSEQPTVEAEKRTHAYWKWDSYECRWICSKCGGVENVAMTPFCKWCGCAMDLKK